MSNELKKEIKIETGNVDVLIVTLLNDISVKLAKLIELQEKNNG